ncbi:MAG: MGMT family protein [Vicinamibacteria bacterium]|jgi:O-6-methylguanine DNA methyltransferase
MVAPKPEGRRRQEGSGFRARVLAAVRWIPRGRVATYGDIAELAGAPGAARAVGNVMRGCGDPSVPCHRVIAAAGGLGGFGGSLERKRQLLRAEGLEVTPTRIRGFAAVRWPVQPRTPRRGAATARRRSPV